MREEQKVVLQLLNSALHGQPKADAEFTPEIRKELMEQTVFYIPATYFSERKDQLLYTRQTILWTNLLEKQTELTHLFQNNGIQVAILKGFAADIYYPTPESRMMGDIDFMTSDFDKAYRLMLDNGYVLAYDEDNVDYHYTLEKDDVIFEIHKYPAGTDKLSRSRQGNLTLLFQNAVLKTEEHELRSNPVYTMPALENGLVLLLHIVKHLSGGLGLRQMIDWMMYVERELDDGRWAEYESVYADNGLNTLAKAVTKTCKKYLGLTGVSWCDDANENLCDELMEYVLAQGNFGRKTKEEDQGAKIMLHGNIFMTMQKSGTVHWNEDFPRFCPKRYRVLKIFAILYAAIRYLKLGMKNGGLRYFSQSRQKANSRKSMLERLGL